MNDLEMELLAPSSLQRWARDGLTPSSRFSTRQRAVPENGNDHREARLRQEHHVSVPCYLFSESIPPFDRIKEINNADTN